MCSWLTVRASCSSTPRRTGISIVWCTSVGPISRRSRRRPCSSKIVVVLRGRVKKNTFFSSYCMSERMRKEPPLVMDKEPAGRSRARKAERWSETLPAVSMGPASVACSRSHCACSVREGACALQAGYVSRNASGSRICERSSRITASKRRGGSPSTTGAELVICTNSASSVLGSAAIPGLRR